MVRGYFRGHPLIWINNKWVYEDNHKDVPVNVYFINGIVLKNFIVEKPCGD